MSKTVSGGHGINIHIHIVSLNVFQWLRYILQTELDTQRNKDNTENSIERQNVGKAKKARLPRCLVLPSVSEWENKFKGRYWGSGLGGLEISIQHQIVNALELSITAPTPNPTPTPLPHPHPTLKSLEAQLSSLSLVAVLLILFVCHVHCGLVQSHSQYCCQSI